MTSNQEHQFVYEMIAIIISSVLMGFTIFGLLSLNDSLPTLIALILTIIWFGWLVSFIIRVVVFSRQRK